MIIFLLSGFWHGANWTFIVWGAYHAILFLPLMFLGNNRKHTNMVANGHLLPTFKECFQMLFTFFWVIIGWIIFRAENIYQACDYLERMFSDFSVNIFMLSSKHLFSLLCILLLLIVEWVQRDKQHGLQFSANGILKYRVCRLSIYYVLVMTILLFAGEQETFIYFQF